ncbi:MAG: hypothetical protein H7Y27_13170, partial [Gemmatimonadaceae bacterium]|nr:hypothetical protein [Chitinophagaceae bacterium]
MKKIFSNPLPAIGWTIAIQIALCLPGTKIPGVGLFELPNLDKIAHVVLFGGFVGLWCYYLFTRNRGFEYLKKWFFIVFLISVVNGVLMEYVQFYLIS